MLTMLTFHPQERRMIVSGGVDRELLVWSFSSARPIAALTGLPRGLDPVPPRDQLADLNVIAVTPAA